MSRGSTHHHEDSVDAALADGGSVMVGSEESGGGGGEGRGEQAVGNIHHQLGHIALTQVHVHVCCSRQLHAIELLESFFCSHGGGGGGGGGGGRGGGRGGGVDGGGLDYLPCLPFAPPTEPRRNTIQHNNTRAGDICSARSAAGAGLVINTSGSRQNSSGAGRLPLLASFYSTGYIYAPSPESFSASSNNPSSRRDSIMPPSSSAIMQCPQGLPFATPSQISTRSATTTQMTQHGRDVKLERLRADRGPMLECNERFAHTLVPKTAACTPSASLLRIGNATSNPIEKQKLTDLEEDFGWIRYLRSPQFQANDEDAVKCRWIHCSSKFPEYLKGFLWALSDDVANVADAMRMLDSAMERQTRFSKHGKYFQPFSQVLRSAPITPNDSIYPMLISLPFLDWGLRGSNPPLRFQVDKREGFLSSRSSAHVMRSILQYYYRLEDTQDREDSQVFSRHTPWRTNRELDLKVRQWYGQYPTTLNVDEIWILAIDAEHIVTFSSNQTWKSRWPPFQLTSRIADVSFRGIRNNYFRSDEKREYNAMTHAIACLSGALGMLHRSFWSDLYLCLADRYAGHLGHLQYRLHRAPSTKLVMDLIACQEELNIVIHITEQQLDAIGDLQIALDAFHAKSDTKRPPSTRTSVRGVDHPDEQELPKEPVSRRSTYRQLSASVSSDPMAQLIDNLERELVDLRDLRDNTDRLVTRTIQLVNIRLEDHGKAILVFTVVTIIFLPLNFVSSFFGMNFRDIRDMETTQWLFWAVAIAVTVSVVASSVFLAFSGGLLLEKLHMWRDARRDTRMFTTSSLRQRTDTQIRSGFRVHGTDKDTYGGSSMQAG